MFPEALDGNWKTERLRFSYEPRRLSRPLTSTIPQIAYYYSADNGRLISMEKRHGEASEEHDLPLV